MSSDSATPFTANADELVALNAKYASEFHDSELDVLPNRKMAVVTCMDARIDTFAVLGLENGDAHIIRNAGGVITDDVIRSLCLSQRAMGTQEIVLVHHTDCGLQKLDEPAFRRELADELGLKPWWSLEAFDDPYEDVRHSIERLKQTPFLLNKDHIRGFVYDVEDGLLHAVT